MHGCIHGCMHGCIHGCMHGCRRVHRYRCAQECVQVQVCAWVCANLEVAEHDGDLSTRRHQDEDHEGEKSEDVIETLQPDLCDGQN